MKIRWRKSLLAEKLEANAHVCSFKKYKTIFFFLIYCRESVCVCVRITNGFVMWNFFLKCAAWIVFCRCCMPTATKCVMGMFFFSTHIHACISSFKWFSNFDARWSVYFWQFHIVPFHKYVWCYAAIQTFEIPFNRYSIFVNHWLFRSQTAIFLI